MGWNSGHHQRPVCALPSFNTWHSDGNWRSSGRVLVADRMWQLLVLLLSANALLCRCLDKEDVIFAVNAGGEAHVDSYGILYQRDFNKVGTESDYGKKLSIQRVKPHDQILYQTERYSQTTFGYDIPIMQDGDYVMVLKFSEVYFTNSGLKVLL